MVLNLTILIVAMLLLNALLLALHQLSPRYGIMPVVSVAAALVAIMRFASAVGVYIQVTPDLRFTVASNLLIPTIILIVLVIYISEGAIPARLTIAVVIGIEILSFLLYYLLAFHLRAPGGGSFAGLPVDDPLLNLSLMTAVASAVAFLIDLFAISVLFQALVNYVPRLPLALKAGLTLIVTLALNSAVFWALTAVDFQEFTFYFQGSLVGTTLSAVLLTPLLALYLYYAAPRLPHYRGLQRRPTFALLFGTFGQIERRLENAQHEIESIAGRYNAHIDLERGRAERLREFVNEVIHDMRSPISGMNLRINLIRRSDDPAHRERQIASMQANLAQLTALVASAAEIARLEREPATALEVRDLHNLAFEVFEPLRIIGETKGLNMAYAHQGDVTLTVRVAPTTFARALSNLLENAVRYTPTGEVRMVTHADGDRALLDVIDTGIGVSDADLPRIFDRYFRTRHAQTEAESGSGLGLAIVKRIVEDQHGGTIAAHRNPTGGMTFSISLPLVRAVDQAETK